MRRMVIGALAAGMVVFAGCSATGENSIKMKVYNDDPTKVMVSVDKDDTALGFVQIGNVVRNNYKAAFAIAAKTTLKNGYKYFTIIEPEKYVELLKKRNPKSVEEYYEMCDSGEGSFRMGMSLRYTIMDSTSCDTIVNYYEESTALRGTVRHGEVFFVIRMSNKPLTDYSLDAKEVLESKLIKELDPDMLKKD